MVTRLKKAKEIQRRRGIDGIKGKGVETISNNLRTTRSPKLSTIVILTAILRRRGMGRHYKAYISKRAETSGEGRLTWRRPRLWLVGISGNDAE